MTAVIVAGGGPVGLLTAALLDAADVPVEVFEKNDAPSEHSKATTVHPRTLEILTTLRVADGRRMADVLLEQGRTTPHTHFATLPRLLDYSDLDTPYPFVLMIPQARTERALLAHLRDRDVPVHYGRPVTGTEQRPDGVRVTVGDTVHEARYLVGADGAHSLVRRLTGVEFPGSPPTSIGFVADVALNQPPRAARHLWFRDTGNMSVLPLPDGRYRVFGTEAADTGLTAEEVRARQAQPLTLPALLDSVRRITGTDCGITEAYWLSRVSDSNRHAARYRTGRVLLAGDAAHVHFPAGGQGLNVGLQDAANLAWKLAAEVHGRAARGTVDGPFGYDHERRPVAARLAANTLAQGALMTTFTPGGEALRDLFTELVARGDGTAAELVSWLSGLGVSYPAPDGHHPLTGTRAPDLALADGSSLMRALHPERFLLVDLIPGGCLSDLATPQVQVRAARPAAGPWEGLAAVLVRPDGHVAHATSHAGPEETARAIAEWAPPVEVSKRAS
ncbi:FAD-dependent monooxygenase [Streptomyces sp. NPDC059740]|uniref:FAD-dependent monooxygenase n=1 Tax=Streptomyces sp. NPDC059740 TaxID=3346926 RepID=UPI0036622FB4